MVVNRRLGTASRGEKRVEALPAWSSNSPKRFGRLACGVYEPRIDQLIDANYFLVGVHWA
jgi:hypothetical protein